MMELEVSAPAAIATLADAALKATALLLLAGLSAVALRRASSALRHAVWLAAACGSLALPLLALALPALNVPVAWETAPVAPPAPARLDFALDLPEAAARNLVAPPAPAPRETDSARRLDWRSAVLAAWMLGAMLVAMRTAASLWRIRDIARRAERAGGMWDAAGCIAAARLGLERPAPLLVSDRVATPATLGLLEPVVLLPACAAAWSDERRVAALLHEFAHVRRRDCASQLAAQLACAVYWFNPLSWLAARALREEREQAADDMVLGAGVRPSDYAGLLLDVACTAPASLPLPAASFAGARRGQLERRLRSILDPRRPRRPAGRAAAILGILAATCVVAPLAAARPPVGTTPEPAPALSAPSVEPQERTSQADSDERERKRAREVESQLRRERATTPSPTPTPTPIPNIANPDMDPDDFERKLEAEREAAARVDDPNDPVVTALREALDDKDEGVRKQAAWALEMIAMRRGQVHHRMRVRPRVRVERQPAPEVEPKAESDETDPDPQQR
jgi:beta-lactamase regulating signal transducer with metallopeptidase domain